MNFSSPHRKSPIRQLSNLALSVSVLAGISVAIPAWSADQENTPSPMQPAIQVATMTVRTETLRQSLNTIGTLTAVQEVELSPEVAGRVTALHFSSGQKVKAGDLLLELNDAPELAQKASAEAKARYAKLQWERSERLARTEAGSVETLQLRKAEYDQAAAAVQELDALIAQKDIRVPFSGQVGIRKVNLGQYVSPGYTVARLAALDLLYVDFTVPEQKLTELKLGGNITVRTSAYPDQSFTAGITAISPGVATETRNIGVQATLQNPDELLRPGLFVTVEIETAPIEGAILVPQTAIQASASGDTAYLVRDGHVQVVPVVTGQRLKDRVVVASGLKAGDTIITKGQLRVYPGAAVKPVPASEAESGAAQ